MTKKAPRAAVLVADAQAREEFVTRIGEVIVDARRAVHHAPACVERQKCFAVAIEGDALAPLKVCSCDYAVRVETSVTQAVVDEIGGASGGRFGGDAVRALYNEPGYLRRINDLEAQLASVHGRALT